MTGPLEVLREKSNAAVAARGYAPRELQARWRVVPPAEYDQGEVIDAIVDALVHEGIPAWSGDGVSCVAQMIRKQYELRATLTRLLAEMDREASVQRERANGLEYQCGIYEARLFRYEQAEKQIWERTPSWLGAQLPALAAYLVKIETERDAMRGALREIADGLPCERDCTAIPPMNCDACGTHRDAPWCAGCIARRALGAL